MTKKNLNNEVEAAAYVFAMLNGATSVDAVQEAKNASLVNKLLEESEEDDDLYEIEGIKEVLGNKPKKKKATSTKKKREPKKTDEEILLEKELADKLPECTFANLKNTTKLLVVLDAHVIPYKEQEWPIPKREVLYDVNLVNSRQKAKYIARTYHKNDTTGELAEKAYNGDEVRYYEIVIPFTTAVPANVTKLGYIEVKADKKFKIFVSKKVLKDNFINYENTMRDIKKTLKAMVEYK